MPDLGSIPPIVASVIGGVLWLLINRVLRKIDNIDERFKTVEQFMQNELRLFDVRLSVLEAQFRNLGK
jgi:hypothetical protein